ncbi:MAG: YaiO family outer membrane beta-barrel protein [Bacteroidota bacterium]
MQVVSVEAATEYESVSGGFADTRGVSSHTILSGGGGTWRLQWSAQERFGEGGVVFGVDHARLLGRTWVASASAGSSTAGAYHARLRASAELGRKWGSRQQIVTTLGIGYHDARDVNHDVILRAEAAYYTGPLVVQLGNRYTISSPGDARGTYVHAALTYSRPDARSISGRIGLGREAYLRVEPLAVEVAFRSWELGMTWTEPVRGRWHLTARATLYHNPFYDRAGLSLGVLRRF